MCLNRSARIAEKTLTKDSEKYQKDAQKQNIEKPQLTGIFFI